MEPTAEALLAPYDPIVIPARRQPFALRRSAVRAAGVLLLSIGFVLAALGIPVPFRVPVSVRARRDTEAVSDRDEPDIAGVGRLRTGRA